MTGSGTSYIWHTAEDEKVRPAHAENNGKIFALDDPPPTGHPGEDYNCRCWAEPVDLSNDIITPINIEEYLFAVAALRKLVLERIGAAIERIFKKVPEPKDILNPGGKPIGRPGNKPKVRVKKGGKEAADELYRKLSRGGKKDTPPGYPGEGTRLPNGDWVGKRPQSKSGEPAVDLEVKDFPYRKIKFPD